jgi:hypothetical protein
MITCITEKDNDIRCINTKNLSRDNIYKKCGFKSNFNFEIIKEWKWNEYTIELWGKSKGNNININNGKLLQKDKINAYGKVIYILSINDTYISFTYNNFIKFMNDQNIFINIDNIDNDIINDEKVVINDSNNDKNDDNQDNKNDDNLDNKNDDNDNDDNDNDDNDDNDSELTEDMYYYSSDEN